MAGGHKVAAMHLALTAEVGQAQRNITKLTKTVDKLSRQVKTGMEKSSAATTRFSNKVQRDMNRGRYALNRMRRAAQLFASAFIFAASIRQIGRLALSVERAEDKVRLMEARFKVFGRGSDTFTKVYQQSQKLGQSLDDTAGGLTRLLIATKNLNVEQEKLLRIQENITILGRAGGSAPEELGSGMRQLFQGVASDRLQGEELRSVLENIPLVAIEIAEHMGINIGLIRQYAKEGKITGQVVVDALDGVKIRLEDLPETFAIQTQRMTTEWDLLLAALGKKLETSKLIETVTGVIKFMRQEGLGDFAGVATEDLKSKVENLVVELGELETKQKAFNKAMAEQAKIQKELGRFGFEGAQPGQVKSFGSGAGTEFFAGLGGGGTGAALGKDQSLAIEAKRRELELLQAELALRAKIDKIAEDRAKADQALIDFDKQAAYEKALERFATKFATAAEKAAALRAELELYRKDLSDGAIAQAEAEITEVLHGGLEEISIKSLPKMKEAMKENADEMSQYAKQAARNIQSAFADFLFDPFSDGLSGMVEGFITAIRRMLAEMLAAQTLEAFFKWGKTLLGSGVGAAEGGHGIPLGSNIFEGLLARASGGPVTSGNPFVVGERGPELFIPGVSGMIMPNNKLGAGGMVNNYHFEAGADVATIRAEIIPMLELTHQRSVNTIYNHKREGLL
jgi:tape measure domain-containing protein